MEATDELIVDEIAGEDDNNSELVVEEDEALPTLISEVPDLETVGWGKKEDGSPVRSDGTIGVAEDGCVGDEEDGPVDFWLPSVPACTLVSWPKTAPPSLRTCLQISSVICIWWICRCCRTLSSSKSTASVGGTWICPCSPDEVEACC